MKVTISGKSKIAEMKIEGAITSENAFKFQEKLDEVLKDEYNFLKLDFSACPNISSSGIGKLLIFYKEFLNRDGEIEVVKSSPVVYELFNTIKLNQLFEINI